MAGCQFGETFEPDPSPGIHIPLGQANTTRPIVFAPQYPLPEYVEAGFEFELAIVLIGPTASAHAVDVWESLRIGGADLGLGLGEDHIPFDVLPSRRVDESIRLELPLTPQSDEVVDTVAIEFTSPLYLTANEGERRRPLFDPSFGDLVRAGLRVLGPLHKLYGQALPESVFSHVKQVAESVPVRSADLRIFEQPKWSHRTKERYTMRGVVGRMTCGPVPAWIVPWLQWGGRLHVGTHRVAGAGGWRVEVNRD